MACQRPIEAVEDVGFNPVNDAKTVAVEQPLLRDMVMWLRAFEIWLTARLLSSPTFHRAVQNMHKQFRDLRHGKDPSEMGGVNIDKPESTGFKKFGQYFIEELRDQLRGGRPRK